MPGSAPLSRDRYPSVKLSKNSRSPSSRGSPFGPSWVAPGQEEQPRCLGQPATPPLCIRGPSPPPPPLLSQVSERPPRDKPLRSGGPRLGSRAFQERTVSRWTSHPALPCPHVAGLSRRSPIGGGGGGLPYQCVPDAPVQVRRHRHCRRWKRRLQLNVTGTLALLA